MTPPQPPWTLAYADGSGNGYLFEADDAGVHFTYDPVTPERSSTGTYSGGDPIDVQLTAEDPRFETLWEHATKLEADKARHAQERNKGDGALTVTSDGNRRRVLIVRAATRTFEDFLERMMRGADET